MDNSVDIDRIVDYKSEYWAYVKKPKLSGNNLTCLCPFHDDKNNSFSVDLTTGKWHCHAEDIGGNFISFYAKVQNIDTKEAYKQILEKYGVTDQGKPASSAASYTLEQYAEEKHFDPEWLKNDCKITNGHDRYQKTDFMRIPYFDEKGFESVFRKRYAKKEFRWKKGSSGKIGMYGEWKLEAIKKAGYVILCEGESDAQSLWLMKMPALGVPGASMFKVDHAKKLEGLKIYIHREKDQGGTTFFKKVTEALKDIGHMEEVRVFSCGDIPECKDPSDVWIHFGEDASKKVMALIQKAEKVELTEDEIPEAIKGAPVNLRQPEGWMYSEEGIVRIDQKTYVPKLVCRTPIILIQRLKSLENGEEKIEVAFLRDGEWQTAIFPRSVIFTTRGITALADLGCTVTSENAKYVVQFLSALEAENIDLIKKADATSTFGWQTHNRFLPGKDEDIVLDIDPSQRSMAAAYMQAGTLDGWIETMRPHRERDKFRFILAASFAAPLLKILKQRIFFVYNWGGSKGGKTAGLKAALSAWGDPDRLMVNFNATQVGLERTAAFYCDLPLGIDERQLAGRNQESLEKIIYMIASGTGKIRGAKSGGIQATYQWRTVAMATGEEPLSTATTQTGVSTRTLEIYGGPFEDEKSASLMHQESPLNCGNAGPDFINKIIGVSEESILSYYERMQTFVNTISDGKNGSHVAGIAAVSLADAIIDTWYFSDEEPEIDGVLKIKPESWRRAMGMAKAIMEEQISASAGDVNENAVQFIVDWVESNRNQFGTNAIGTCFGTMSDSGNVVYLFPSILTQALERAGYSARKTLKYMADMGLIGIETRKDNKGQTYSKVRRFDGRRCRFIEFYIGKIAEKQDEIDIDEPDPDPASPFDAKQKTTPTEEGFVTLPDDAELPFK